MASDSIVQLGDAILREQAVPVPSETFGTPQLRKIISHMKKALSDERFGAAIAAPQIGENLRIFVVAGAVVAGKERDPETGKVDTEENEADTVLPELVCINPKLTKLSRKKEDMEEGCLSVRGKYGLVPRSIKATVRAFDEHGTPFERGASGLLAQVFQHEVDHLNGVLFIDRARDVWEYDDTAPADEHTQLPEADPSPSGNQKS